ncbi:sensor histidine kinase [Sphingomonas sp. NFR15]|uniref:sensor histidine kinase n=1 Tax=Sphingomonas sp. NFR15 TaxID=1566282 RepID=UPI00088413B0|nr:ATP-binding protein [Sphingomonas sp. NFR15]SDA35897.1 Histidine kinase-, DNA gyrase B-, and HSP90-like ATPase [Sphingomonas sp. NFR15]
MATDLSRIEDADAASDLVQIAGSPGILQVVPIVESDWSDTWYRVFMQVSSISFVVVDARKRMQRCRELGADGVTNLVAHLSMSPEDAAIIRSGATILDINETGVRVFGGSSKADFIGQTTNRFFSKDCTALQSVADAYLQGQTAFQQQATNHRLDGSTFESLFCVVMRVPGASDGVWLAGFIDNSAEQRQRAMTNVLRDELAHVSRISTLGEMSASIAHELGQALATIGTSVQAALNYLNLPEPNVDAAKRACGRVAAQTVRASEIIDRVRGMAARRPGTATPVTIGELVQDSVGFVRHEFERTSIALSYGIEDEDLVVVVDRVQIQQLLVNLLMNATQALRDHETGMPTISVNARRDGRCIVLEVRDNGPGMAEEDLPQVFDSFFSTKSDGLGLGLSICRSIVEAHGGSISAANRTDRSGAVITVELPVSE